LLSALALSACDSADPIGVNTPDATVAAGDTGSAAADATAQPGDDAAAPAGDATPTPDDDAAQPADDAAVVVVPDAGFAPDAAAPDAEPMPLPRFSFFVTSIEAMRQLSGSNDGFGGNLSYDGATGLEGADRICAAAAELGQPGAGRKTWRAFLSASTGGANGGRRPRHRAYRQRSLVRRQPAPGGQRSHGPGHDPPGRRCPDHQRPAQRARREPA
jgi:hypothetical protein